MQWSVDHIPTSTNWWMSSRKSKQTELTVVQLEAGSQPPRKRYTAVDERLAKLKTAYTDGDKTIDQYIVGVAYNLSIFM